MHRFRTPLLFLLLASSALAQGQPDPSPAAAASPVRIGGVSLDLGLSKESRRKYLTNAEETMFDTLAYQSDRKGGAVHIYATLAGTKVYQAAKNGPIPAAKDILRMMREGGTLEEAGWTDLSFEFPCLDLKVLNNSSKTLLFTEALVAVKKSTPDLCPVIFLESGYDQIQRVHVVNDGWGRIDSGKLDFDLLPVDAKPTSGKRRFHRDLGPFSEDMDLTLTPELKAAGVDADALGTEKAMQMDRAAKNAALGKLAPRKTQEEDMDPSAYVRCVGELELDWKDAGGAAKKTRLKFNLKVLVTPPDGLGAPGPIQGAYETLLEIDKSDYVVRVPITQEVKPGKMTRFTLTLGALQSSAHDLVIRLATADGAAVESPPVRLDLALTRSCARALKDGKAAEAPTDEGDGGAPAPASTPQPEASPLPRTTPSAGDAPPP